MSMPVPRPTDAKHKAWLMRLLSGVIDREALSTQLCFKGGTCAAMLGYLDRFSVDLDFDRKAGSDLDRLRALFHEVFNDLGLEVKDESTTTLLFHLRYETPVGERSSVRLDVVDEAMEETICIPRYLPEVDRYMNCQTIETMFAHKLVALIDRFEKHGSVAGRDLYDINRFFLAGHRYRAEIIRARRGISVEEFFEVLIEFVKKHVTRTVLDQDLNTMLPSEKFQQIRYHLKQETVVFLQDELNRLQ